MDGSNFRESKLIIFQQQGKCEGKGKNTNRYRREDDPENDADMDENVDVDTETERSKNWISPVLVSFCIFQVTNLIPSMILEIKFSTLRNLKS